MIDNGLRILRGILLQSQQSLEGEVSDRAIAHLQICVRILVSGNSWHANLIQTGPQMVFASGTTPRNLTPAPVWIGLIVSRVSWGTPHTP